MKSEIWKISLHWGFLGQVLRYHVREAVVVVVVGVAKGVKGGESVLIYLLLLLLWKGSARLAQVARSTAIRQHWQRRKSVAVTERIAVVVVAVASPRNLVIAAGRRGRSTQSASATARHVRGRRHGTGVMPPATASFVASTSCLRSSDDDGPSRTTCRLYCCGRFSRMVGEDNVVVVDVAALFERFDDGPPSLAATNGEGGRCHGMSVVSRR
mmetsp:Transcript_9967/g.18209  ORF Transcript_9967/g.18209 Transcript_9967/m.18209 type:complete len:212 (+) Transcript_9967:365-1000(+)